MKSINWVSANKSTIDGHDFSKNVDSFCFISNILSTLPFKQQKLTSPYINFLDNLKCRLLTSNKIAYIGQAIIRRIFIIVSLIM